MDTLLISPFIQYLQSLPPEAVSFLLLLACIASILFLLKYSGEHGLYIYSIVAILASNIQVLQGVQFSFSKEPIAMGTILFATTYLCSDILTEHFGSGSAKKGVYYAFLAQLLMTLFMTLSLGHAPLLGEGNSESLKSTDQMFIAGKAIAVLFTPSPRLIFASLLAFVISQLADIALFQNFQRLTQKKYLWFRTLMATLIASLIDTLIFSLFAWVILAPEPISFKSLWMSYIGITMFARTLIAFISLPIMYMSYRCLPKRPLYAASI